MLKQILSFALFVLGSLQAPADACLLDDAATPAIELLVQFQSQLISQFATSNQTKVSVIYTSPNSKAKLQKTVYRFLDAKNGAFFVGIEFQIVKGKAEVIEFYQAATLRKVANFFDIQLSDTPLDCPGINEDLVVFLDDYLDTTESNTYPTNPGSVGVPVYFGSTLNSDTQDGKKNNSTNSSKNATSHTPNATVSNSPVTNPSLVANTSSVSIPVQTTASAPQDISNVKIWVPSVTDPTLPPVTTVTTDRNHDNATIGSVQAAADIKSAAGSDYSEPDRVIINYISDNFMLAYPLTIFHKIAADQTAIVAAPKRRLVKIITSHPQKTDEDLAGGIFGRFKRNRNPSEN